MHNFVLIWLRGKIRIFLNLSPENHDSMAKRGRGRGGVGVDGFCL